MHSNANLCVSTQLKLLLQNKVKICELTFPKFLHHCWQWRIFNSDIIKARKETWSYIGRNNINENNVFLQLIPHGMVVSLRTKWPADRKENNFLECFSELLGMGGGWAWDTCSLDVATWRLSLSAHAKPDLNEHHHKPSKTIRKQSLKNLWCTSNFFPVKFLHRIL